MGRKFNSKAKGRKFADVDQSMQEAYEAESDRINTQWDDLNKLVPIYELNGGSNEVQPQEENVRQRKRPPLRNAGDFSKGIRISEVQKEVDMLATKRDRKRFQREQKLAKRNESAINGANVSGAPPIKRTRNEPTVVVNGSHSNGSPSKRPNGKQVRTSSISSNESFNKSATFIELSDLKAGPVINQSYFEEGESNANYFVIDPSDDEENGQENGYKMMMQEDFDSDESEDSYGIDLMDESEGEFEEIQSGESDADFINDIEEEEEVSADEIDFAEEILKKESKKRKVHIESEEDSDESPVQNAVLKRQKKKIDFNLPDDYLSSSDDEEFVGPDESIDESEGGESESCVSSNEVAALLHDITGSDEEMIDSDDEERILHLDPLGLKLKPMNLSIDGYKVDESMTTLVKVQKDKENEEAHESPLYGLFCFSTDDEHSVYTAIKAFKWLIFPVGIQEFFEGIYSKKTMVVKRSNSGYYKGVFSTSAFYNIFRQNFVEYGVNINVARYKNGIRTTHNPEGRAYAGGIHSFINQGMSIQCVNPQTFDKNVHYICDVLQEIFNCFVGANCYYTPKGSAGFAPHFDDIDAFIIQTEGQKHWKVYAPSDEEELWPLASSENFTVEEMENRKDDLVFDGVLKAGDVLYMPRGFIHCAKTDAKHDSLHVTISVSQNHAYCNLLEKVTSKLLEAKTTEIAQLRKNLPINLLDIEGVANSTYENDGNLEKSLHVPISLYLEQFQIGLSDAIPAAIDDIGRDFMRKALPPLLTDHEKMHSIHGLNGQLPDIPLFSENLQIRFIRKHTQRLLFESESEAFLIHRMENSMVHEGRPEVTVNVPQQFIGGIETLLKSYPEWTPVEKISDDSQVNVEVAQFLYDIGLLMVQALPEVVPRESPVKKKKSLVEGAVKPMKKKKKHFK